MNFINLMEKNYIAQLLDFYNPEVMAWQLQNVLLTQSMIPLKLQPQKTLTELVEELYHVKLICQKPGWDQGVRFLNYAPQFKQQIDKLWYFDDDIFIFFSLTSNKKILELSGRQVLVMTELRPVNLYEKFNDHLEIVGFKVEPGNTRKDLAKYLNQINLQEWSIKNQLSYAIALMGLNGHCSVTQQQLILQERNKLFQFNTIIDLEKLKYLKNLFEKVKYLQELNPVMHKPVTDFRSSLKITLAIKWFGVNLDNREYLKKIKSADSYEFHINKFIKKLGYIYRKSQKFDCLPKG